MQTRTRKSAFSLTELLVVITIIAILSALLFAVFSGSKESAKMTVCTSNLRQMFLAFDLYAADWSGWENPAPKVSDLQSYVSKDVMHCPSHIPHQYPQGYREKVGSFPPSSFISYPISYAYIRDFRPLDEAQYWNKVIQVPSIGLFACAFHGPVTPNYDLGLDDWKARSGPILRVCMDGHIARHNRSEIYSVAATDLFYLPENSVKVLFQ